MSVHMIGRDNEIVRKLLCTATNRFRSSAERVGAAGQGRRAKRSPNGCSSFVGQLAALGW